MWYWVFYLQVSGWWSSAVDRIRALDIVHLAHGQAWQHLTWPHESGQCVCTETRMSFRHRGLSVNCIHFEWEEIKNSLWVPRLALVWKKRKKKEKKPVIQEVSMLYWSTFTPGTLSVHAKRWGQCGMAAQYTVTNQHQPLLFWGPTWPQHVIHLQNKHMLYLLQGLCVKISLNGIGSKW